MTFTARMYTNLGNRIGIEPQEWREHAACRDADPETFFPDKGFDYDRQVAEALEFCRRCPVTAECLEAGRNEKVGIWGGKPPRDRKPKRDLFDGWCQVCDGRIYRKSREGAPSVYCSNACRQRAYKQRRTA